MPYEPRPEDEIDLTALLRTLLRAWKVLLGVTLLALGLASAYLLWAPPVYEAAAFLGPARGGAEDAGEGSAEAVARALGLAESPGLLEEVRAALGPKLRSHSLEEVLAGAQASEARRDSGVIRLAFRAQDPEEAALFANAWARALALRVDDLYLGRAPRPLAELGTEGDPSRMALLQADLEAQKGRLKALALTLGRLEALEAELRALRAQVAQGPGPSLADRLTASLLQLKAYGVGALGEGPGVERESVSVAPGLFLDLSALASSPPGREAFLAGLEGLAQALAARREDLREEALRLRERMVELERAMAAITWASGVGVYLRVSAFAEPPSRPVAPRPFLVLGVAAVSGLFLGILAVFLGEALRASRGEGA